MPNAYLEINLDYLEHNLKKIKQIIGENIEILAIVKANAYGHGLKEIAFFLQDLGINYFGVANLEEALYLRKNGITKNILNLGAVLTEQAEIIVKNKITQAITNLEVAERISQISKTLNLISKVHLKIDTGMGRLGVFPKEALGVVQTLKNLPNLDLEGIFTHYASAPEENKDYTKKQWKIFKEVLKKVKASKIEIPYQHVGNSATVIDLPYMKLNMVRPGAMIYGIYPNNHMKKKIKLMPVMSLKAKIVSLKKFNQKSAIGYGRTYFASKGSTIAIIPVGYADGYSRLFTKKTCVLFRGKKIPIIGRICMDQFMLDLKSIKDPKLGEKVVILGAQGKEEIRVDDLAKLIKTINYEIVCSFSYRLPRIYFKGGKILKVSSIFEE